MVFEQKPSRGNEPVTSKKPQDFPIFPIFHGRLVHSSGEFVLPRPMELGNIPPDKATLSFPGPREAPETGETLPSWPRRRSPSPLSAPKASETAGAENPARPPPLAPPTSKTFLFALPNCPYHSGQAVGLPKQRKPFSLGLEPESLLSTQFYVPQKTNIFLLLLELKGKVLLSVGSQCHRKENPFSFCWKRRSLI